MFVIYLNSHNIQYNPCRVDLELTIVPDKDIHICLNVHSVFLSHCILRVFDRADVEMTRIFTCMKIFICMVHVHEECYEISVVDGK